MQLKIFFWFHDIYISLNLIQKSYVNTLTFKYPMYRDLIFRQMLAHSRLYDQFETCKVFCFNPFTLRVAKTCMIILKIFHLRRHFFENIWRRNVHQKTNNNTLSNMLWTYAFFRSYFQNYESSRQYFLEKLWVLIG